MNLPPPKIPRFSGIIFNLAVFLIVCAILISGGYKYYSIESQRIKNNKYQEIKAITDLKVDQILIWKKERVADARQFSESPLFKKALKEWIVTQNSSQKEDLLIRLNLIKKLRGIENILIVSPDKKPLIGTEPKAKYLSINNSGSLDSSLASGKIYISDFHPNAQSDQIQLIIAAPIIINARTIAVVLMQINPERVLFPLIQKWPTSNKTAETILIGKQGDRVILLNLLNPKIKAGFSQSIPLSMKAHWAVQAVMGYEGILEGKNHKGIEVLSYIRPISGTPWFIITQINKDEIYTELQYRAETIIAFIAISVLLCIITMIGYYHYRQRNIYKQLLTKGLDLNKKEEEFRTTLYSIGDGVITTDISGYVKQLNPEAERLTGWTERKAAGKIIDEVFRIIDGKSRQPVINPVQETLKKENASEPVTNTILLSKEGKEIPIAWTCAPIKTKTGELLGVVLVFKNQTREYEIQNAMEETKAKLTNAELISHTGYWEYDLNSGIVKGSIGAQKIFGINEPEFEFSEARKLFLPEYKDRTDEALQQVVQNEGSYKDTFKIKQYETGKIIDIYIIAKYNKDKNMIIGTLQDITKRVKAEEDLDQQHKLLRALIDSIPDYIYVKDLNSRFLLANKVCAEGLGTTIENAIGKYDFDFFPESVAREFYDDEQSLLKTGITILNKEENFTDHSGRSITLLTTKFPLYDSHGQIIGLAGTGHDITDRKIVELALKLSEEKYRFLIENANEAIFVIQNGYVKYGNKKIEELTGYTQKQIMSTSFFDYFHPEDLRRAKENYFKKIDGIETHTNATYRLLHGSGQFLWMNINSARIEWEGNPATLNFMNDITGQKMAEQEIIRARDRAERSDRLKTAFLQNMSHEIRTPMNAIVGFANLLNQSDDTSAETQKEFIEIIINSSSQLLSIIDDVLTVSRIQTGHEIVTSTPTRVNEILNNLYSIYKPKAMEKGITLGVYKQIETPQFTIVTDATKLTQILTNLLNNSFKFTEKGSIDFGYTLNTDFIEFFVKDTGIGIAPEVQEIIFERFAQANSSIPQQYGGTGLGLSISKGYAEIQGGSMRLLSTPGKGSTFYLTLPIKLTNEPDFQVPKPQPTEYKIPKTILIAEDETFNYLLIKEYLAKSCSTLLFARNGIEAVEMCRENPDINLVLMDIKMPLMDGFTAMKEIKLFRPDLPIIAQTAYALIHEKQRFLRSGFDDYISKPIKKEELLEKINALYKE